MQMATRAQDAQPDKVNLYIIGFDPWSGTNETF